jgi:hypothetical protein
MRRDHGHESWSSLAGDRLDPAECLLDALADAPADGITVVSGRSSVNRRPAAAPPTRRMPLGQCQASPELIPEEGSAPGFDIA